MATWNIMLTWNTSSWRIAASILQIQNVMAESRQSILDWNNLVTAWNIFIPAWNNNVGAACMDAAAVSIESGSVQPLRD